jgi:hypothetical protein
VSVTLEIPPTFVETLRVAADDPTTSPVRMRDAMRDAANILEGHTRLIAMQQQWIDQLRVRTGAAHALTVTILVLVAIWFVWFA